MPIPNIERMDDRMAAVLTAMQEYPGLVARVIKRSLTHYKNQSEYDLKKGILTLVSAGEGDYNQGLGMIARDGTHRMLIIGQLKADDNNPESAEDMELDMIEEVKSFVRSGIDGMDLMMDNVKHSRQQEAPYGWFVIYMDAGPQRNSLY